jgi:hypothetical protein
MPERVSPPAVDFQAGSGATDASGEATVTFPRPFSSVPKVFLQGVDTSARGIVLDVVSKTTTGFTVKARKITGVNSGGGVSTVDPAVGGVAYTHNYSDPEHTHGGTTSSGGVDHTHSYSGTTGIPSSTTSVADGYWPTLVVTGVDASTGGPNVTVSVAEFPHRHQWGSVTAVESWVTPPYRLTLGWWDSGGNYYSGGSYRRYIGSEAASSSILYTSAETNTIGVGASNHTHTIGKTTGNYGITGLHAVDVASSDHKHSISGSTGSASAYSHTHGFTTGSSSTNIILLVSYHYHTSDSPVLSASFDWLAILS